jgi:hypothetical protein
MRVIFTRAAGLVAGIVALETFGNGERQRRFVSGAPGDRRDSRAAVRVGSFNI